MTPLRIAWFGSSLVSAYWNGAATYYRGLCRALARRGHRLEFYEPDAFDRQAHRDIADPDWTAVTVYAPNESAAAACLERARDADVLIKSSGIGVLDHFLERELALAGRPGTLTVFWDVDAPATLARLAETPDDPLHRFIPSYDMVLTYGGGPPVIAAYRALGARRCVPVYNALDPSTHYPVRPRAEFKAALGFLGNRLPDREARVAEFFFGAAECCPELSFVLGGSGWKDVPAPANVRMLGHVYTRDHNAFNASTRAVLNICRDSMARNGWSPATRVFEAAGAGACIITDDWQGVGEFLTPGTEALVARTGAEVAEQLRALSPRRAQAIGAAARARVLAEHTYAARALMVERLLEGTGSAAASPPPERTSPARTPW